MSLATGGTTTQSMVHGSEPALTNAHLSKSVQIYGTFAIAD